MKATMWRSFIHSISSENPIIVQRFCQMGAYLFRSFPKLKGPVRPYSFHAQDNSYKKVQISIEGNIGSGKSTFLERINKTSSNIEISPEPIHQWTSLKGGNLLTSLYSDPKRWSFVFQSYVLLSMLRIHHHQPQVKQLRFVERSVFSASYCFVENLYRSQLMSEMEYNVYHEWFQWILDFERPNLNMIVYLRTTPEKCFERIQQRSREEDGKITIDLLKQIHNCHEEWLMSKASHPVPAPVLVIDGNKEIEDLSEFYKNDGQKIFRLAVTS